MRNKIAMWLVAVCLLVSTSGCAVVTKGSGGWEVYGGIRTHQDSEQPASVGIESAVAERMIDNLTDGKTTEAE